VWNFTKLRTPRRRGVVSPLLVEPHARLDEEPRIKWKDNRLYARPDCVACPIKYACGGGCRLDSLERQGDIHRPDPTGCFFRQTMFRTALWVLCKLGPEKLQTIIRNPREYRRQMQRSKLLRRIESMATT